MQRISVEKIQQGMILAKSIYNAAGRLLLTEGTQLNAILQMRLISMGVYSVFIDTEYDFAFEAPDPISEKTRAEATTSVQRCFRHYSLTQEINAKKVTETVGKIVSEVISNKDAVIQLTEVRNHDDYTFQHSTNVCVMAVMLGKAAGHNVNDLKKIGIGALLHDLGKIQVPKTIINKPGRLTRDEMSCIKQHPQAGFDIIRKNTNFSLLSAHIALDHHERFDGSGYPHGIEGQEIHEFARLTSICDVYDALTSDRPYRKGMPANQAYDTLLAGSGSQFDPELLRLFVQRIAIYPLGGFVELSTGEIAVVTKITAGIPWRPCVMPVLDAQKQKILEWKEINLARTFNITITRILEEDECIQFCSNVMQNKKEYDAQASQ